MQEEAGAEPKRHTTRLGLRNERERAGRGKGRPKKAKRGSYGRAGEGGGEGRGGGSRGGKGRESGARAGPGRSSGGGAEKRRPCPAQAASAGGTTRREAGAPRGSRPRPDRAWRPRRGAAAPPSHVWARTSSQQGRSGEPVRSLQIVSPRLRRLTDPDINPRRGRPAPPESHCACVTQTRAPPPVRAPPTPVTRQRGRP